jgi:hypothetical protein
MILGFINRMACFFQTHAGILRGKQPFLKPYRNNPIKHWGKTVFALFISDQRSEHSSAFFVKACPPSFLPAVNLEGLSAVFLARRLFGGVAGRKQLR